MSIAESQKLLLADFAALPDWGERYRYIIALGSALSPMPERLLVPANRVLSCASRTYFWAGIENGAIALHADSNAAIPLGLAAILHRIYAEATPYEAVRTLLTFPEESGLLGNLTGTRLMGFQEMAAKLRNLFTANPQ